MNDRCFSDWQKDKEILRKLAESIKREGFEARDVAAFSRCLKEAGLVIVKLSDLLEEAA